MLEMTVGSPRRAICASSSCETPSLSAMTSRKRPVPAEHLSFMTKRFTAPPTSSITLVSWPPTSTTRPSGPKRYAAPRPWQVISVTALSA